MAGMPFERPSAFQFSHHSACDDGDGVSSPRRHHLSCYLPFKGSDLLVAGNNFCYSVRPNIGVEVGCGGDGT